MKRFNLILFTLNFILILYWSIKNNTLENYAEQYSKWEIGSELSSHKFYLSRDLVIFPEVLPKLFNLNYLKLLSDLNENINTTNLTTTDSLVNKIVEQNESLTSFPYEKPNFNKNDYPPEFESILNKLLIRSIANYISDRSQKSGYCCWGGYNLIKIPNGHSIRKYSLIYLNYPCNDRYFNGTYFVIGNDRILDPSVNPYIVSSPLDSTTIIYKFVKQYGEKDSLISTFKTKIIELD
ncbi:MAG: hypothetical protein IPK88_06640 [Saprospiraceae bacterium]|uniref:Uncharacterized protein n=1 Tax=Candidatus Defluviibacterium haderslevense TaxID=2981993 RepID=A0A9D7S702_9BACT|nr:hypothetical protein [Candidatus Defluviibacterium haderslevense]MBK9716332.1 hypothetical protein [Candidatus Defluviibacterium haderslevense]MBL0238674.1 hypothetical protein [Candidatus Defluviibacterium haderslevense]